MGKVSKKYNMKSKSPEFFCFILKRGGIKSFKNVKGGMYQKRLGTTGVHRNCAITDLPYLNFAGASTLFQAVFIFN